MARSSMGNKATRTKKCSCDNPVWRVCELHITSSGEIVTTLDCCNCKSFWDTKSREARKYCHNGNPEEIYHKSNSGKTTTYQDVFNKADEIRTKYLNSVIDSRKDIISNAEKEIKKAEKELSEIKQPT